MSGAWRWWLVAVAALGLLAVALPMQLLSSRLPEPIAVHWGPDLQPDGARAQLSALTPPAVIIAGALNAPEELHTRSVLDDGTNSGKFVVSINITTPAAYRLGLRANAKDANLVVLQNTFMVGGSGKIIRLRRNGSEQYAIVASVDPSKTCTLPPQARPTSHACSLVTPKSRSRGFPSLMTFWASSTTAPSIQPPETDPAISCLSLTAS